MSSLWGSQGLGLGSGRGTWHITVAHKVAGDSGFCALGPHHLDPCITGISSRKRFPRLALVLSLVGTHQYLGKASYQAGGGMFTGCTWTPSQARLSSCHSVFSADASSQLSSLINATASTCFCVSLLLIHRVTLNTDLSVDHPGKEGCRPEQISVSPGGFVHRVGQE